MECEAFLGATLKNLQPLSFEPLHIFMWHFITLMTFSTIVKCVCARACACQYCMGPQVVVSQQCLYFCYEVALQHWQVAVWFKFWEQDLLANFIKWRNKYGHKTCKSYLKYIASATVGLTRLGFNLGRDFGQQLKMVQMLKYILASK